MTLVPSAAAADQDVYQYWTMPKGKLKDVDVQAACSALAPQTQMCSTGNHTWREPARLGILFSCPTCHFEGIVINRIIHASGTFDFTCQLHSVPMASTGYCWLGGSPPKKGETIEHQCVSTPLSVGRYSCSFATFANPPQPPTPPPA